MVLFWFLLTLCLFQGPFSPSLPYIIFKQQQNYSISFFLNNLCKRFFSDDSNFSTTCIFPCSPPHNLGINHRVVGIIISIFTFAIVISTFAGWSLAWKTECCYRAIEKVSPASGYSRVPKWPQLGHFLDPKTQGGLSPNTWLLLETWRPPHISSGATNFTHIDKHMKKTQTYYAKCICQRIW